MHIRLADVFMHAIVGDELGRRGTTALACALRVDERIVVVQVGQQSGAGLHSIFAGQSQIGDRGAVLRIVEASPLQRILQGDGDGGSGRRGGSRALCLFG